MDGCRHRHVWPRVPQPERSDCVFRSPVVTRCRRSRARAVFARDARAWAATGSLVVLPQFASLTGFAVRPVTRPIVTRAIDVGVCGYDESETAIVNRAVAALAFPAASVGRRRQKRVSRHFDGYARVAVRTESARTLPGIAAPGAEVSVLRYANRYAASFAFAITPSTLPSGTEG